LSVKEAQEYYVGIKYSTRDLIRGVISHVTVFEAAIGLWVK